jgi:AbrB family looped-hinge helix DNA binding protein
VYSEKCEEYDLLDKQERVSFVGGTVVGERGQVVIPVEARRILELNPGDRLVVLLPPGHEGVMLAKVEAIQRAIDALVSGLAQSIAEGGESVGDESKSD